MLIVLHEAVVNLYLSPEIAIRTKMYALPNKQRDNICANTNLHLREGASPNYSDAPEPRNGKLTDFGARQFVVWWRGGLFYRMT